MFGLFKKKDNSPQPDYNVFISEVAKYRYIINLLKKSSNSQHILLYHFENTENEIKQLLTAAGISFSNEANSSHQVTLLSSNEFLSNHVSGKIIFVVEIYPLSDKDTMVITHAVSLSLEIKFFTAVDSPFFKLFGGDHLTGLMQNLGLQSDEAINHPMIAKSIGRAQNRLLKQVTLEKPEAESIEKWMVVNSIEKTG